MCFLLFLFHSIFLGCGSWKLNVRDETYRQVVPQLALLHLQRRLRQVELGDGEPRDGVVQVEPKGHQPDVDVCNVGMGSEVGAFEDGLRVIHWLSEELARSL